jgi:hypothetical protein
MKQNEIKVGCEYMAKVSNKIVKVRVDSIEETERWKRPAYGNMKLSKKTIYHVTNLSTGRKTTFKSAAKFRSKVKESPKKGELNHLGGNVYDKENEDGSIDIIF